MKLVVISMYHLHLGLLENYTAKADNSEKKQAAVTSFRSAAMDFKVTGFKIAYWFINRNQLVLHGSHLVRMLFYMSSQYKLRVECIQAFLIQGTLTSFTYVNIRFFEVKSEFSS